MLARITFEIHLLSELPEPLLNKTMVPPFCAAKIGNPTEALDGGPGLNPAYIIYQWKAACAAPAQCRRGGSCAIAAISGSQPVTRNRGRLFGPPRFLVMR